MKKKTPDHSKKPKKSIRDELLAEADRCEKRGEELRKRLGLPSKAEEMAERLKQAKRDREPREAIFNTTGSNDI
jgi:hypothetical protein